MGIPFDAYSETESAASTTHPQANKVTTRATKKTRRYRNQSGASSRSEKTNEPKNSELNSSGDSTLLCKNTIHIPLVMAGKIAPPDRTPTAVSLKVFFDIIVLMSVPSLVQHCAGPKNNVLTLRAQESYSKSPY